MKITRWNPFADFDEILGRALGHSLGDGASAGWHTAARMREGT